MLGYFIPCAYPYQKVLLITGKYLKVTYFSLTENFPTTVWAAVKPNHLVGERRLKQTCWFAATIWPSSSRSPTVFLSSCQMLNTTPVIYHTIEKHWVLKVQVTRLLHPFSIWDGWGHRLVTVTHVRWIVRAGEARVVKRLVSRDGNWGLPAQNGNKPFKGSLDTPWGNMRSSIHVEKRDRERGNEKQGISKVLFYEASLMSC